MNSQRSSYEQGFWLLVVGLAAWAVPGAGHFLIRERKRAIIIFVTITLLFATGLYVGSVGVVDKVGSKPWFIAQMLCSPAVGILAQHTQGGYVDSQGHKQKYEVFGRADDIGHIYTGIAGLLNLLCVFSAVYMAYCGRGELIGHEEDQEPANA